jgi:hypothetical protein
MAETDETGTGHTYYLLFYLSHSAEQRFAVSRQTGKKGVFEQRFNKENTPVVAGRRQATGAGGGGGWGRQTADIFCCDYFQTT